MWIELDHFAGGMLRFTRHFHGLDREELAEKCPGMTRRTIADFEGGRRMPTPAQEAMLADALDVFPKFFYQVNDCPLGAEDFHFCHRTPLGG